VAAQAGVDRKTGKRYVTAAVEAGLSREGGEEQLTDELMGQVVSVVRPVRPDGHGQGWAELEARRDQIAGWVEGGVPVVKIGVLLARQGVVVAERTLHRFAAGRCGAAGSKVTTRVDDGPPGSELQIDFGDLGLIPAGDGRRRKLRALVFTACFSRYMFVYLTFSMTLEEVIAGCEEAWQFFSGVFRVVVPDNMSPVVAKADTVNPQLTREWLEYAQARGFATDPARVRHPGRALDVDVIDVSKIESMLKNATEKAPAAAGLAAAASGGRGRFARDAAEYATATGIRLRVVPGGDPATAAGGEGGPPARPGDRS